MRGTARERGARHGEATGASEYEHLRATKKQRRGNAERATVREVFVGEDEVVLSLGFDWTTDTERVVYDLDDDRDVLELEALAESKGFDFETLGLLEGEPLEAVYTGSRWLPDVRRSDADRRVSRSGASVGTARRESQSSAASPTRLGRASRFVRGMTTKQLIVAVVLVKKLVVIALLVWLVL